MCVGLLILLHLDLIDTPTKKSLGGTALYVSYILEYAQLPIVGNYHFYFKEESKQGVKKPYNFVFKFVCFNLAKSFVDGL